MATFYAKEDAVQAAVSRAKARGIPQVVVNTLLSDSDSFTVTSIYSILPTDFVLVFAYADHVIHID